MQLQKVHGSENNFFILDQTQFSKKLSDDQIDQLRKSVCPKESGLLSGADGILVVEKAQKSLALGKMRVINYDGSEASMCGNGLRTVARYLAEKNHQESFQVETKFAELKVRKAPELFDGVATYQVEISPVTFDLAAVPAHLNQEGMHFIDKVIPELSDTIRFSIVSVPNPHLIAFADHDTLNSEVFTEIAEKVNQPGNPLFPDGINVSFAEVLGDNELFVRTYERGVGLTNACGTAMSASSLIYVLVHDKEFMAPITVKNAGGLVKTVVHEHPEGGYWMELVGNATVTHQISGELEDLMAGNFSQLAVTETAEQAQYEKFLQTI